MKLHGNRVLGALALALTLVLAACSQPATPTTASDTVTLTLSVAEQPLSGQSTSPITTLGAPFHPATGSTAIEELQVTVTDTFGQAIAFSFAGNTYTADPAGTIDYITLNKTAPNGALESANVVLPSLGNPYTFESAGYFDVAEPVIAFASQTQNVSNTAIVTLLPVSVLGAAEITPRLPTNFVAPGSVLDLMLVVTANGNTSLQVPLADFSASYDLPAGGPLTLIAESNRGVRVQVGSECSTAFTVGSTAAGLVQTGAGFAQGVVTANGGAGIELRCPPLDNGNVQVDTAPPTIQVTAYDAVSLVVEGTADDNVAIALVEIYDGPELVATTDIDAATGSVSLITFTGTTFTTTLTAAPYAGITAVARDTSGNQATDATFAVTASAEFAHCPANTNLYVSAVSGNDISAVMAGGTPFATIQAAVNTALAGDTLCVAAGTYLSVNPGGNYSAINITNPVTLVGPNVGIAGNGSRGPEAEIVVSSTELSYVRGITVWSGDVVIDGFAITTDTPQPDLVGSSGMYGVTVRETAGDNVTIRNLRITDMNAPIWVNRGRAADAAGYVIEGNLIDGLNQHSDQAIMVQGASGNVLNNVVRNARVGIQMQPYHNGGTGEVSGNDLEVFQVGLWFNYLEDAAGSYEFSDNNVRGIASPVAWPLYTTDPTAWSGIRIETFYEGYVSFDGNTVVAGAANPTGNTYLVRQRNVINGTVANIGTATELGTFFTSNLFPEILGGVSLADLTEDAWGLQLIRP